jgi:curved DNA-binding protein CbpA
MELLTAELELLGLPPTSSPTLKDLRKAFKKKSILLLPERHPSAPNAHSTFEELNASFVKVRG